MPDGGYTSRSREYSRSINSKKVKHERDTPMSDNNTCGKKKRWGVATMYLWFVVAPIFIWIVLFSTKPSFVSDNVNGEQIISQQRLLLWTLIFSVVSWIIIYAIYYCKY